MSTLKNSCIALISVVIVLFISQANGAPVTRKFGSQPFDDVLASAKAAKKCNGLTTNKLAVMMLVPSWWETVGGSMTVTPSPMTLSRADFGSKNLKLYSQSTYATDVRAFSHPGIGLWQIDDSGPIGSPLAAHERINTQTSSTKTAAQIATTYCQASGIDSDRRKKAWSAWFACKGSNCEQTFQNHYNAKTDAIQRIVRDTSVTRLGGMFQRTCVFKSTPQPNTPPNNQNIPCHYINPSLAQGFKGSWQGVPSGGVSGKSPSPLSLPFYSLINTPFTNEFRLWATPDTKYTGEIFTKRTKGTDSRLSTVWSKLINIKCVLTGATLKCEPPPPIPPNCKCYIHYPNGQFVNRNTACLVGPSANFGLYECVAKSVIIPGDIPLMWRQKQPVTSCSGPILDYLATSCKQPYP